jgi:hypothetical protein
MNNHSKKLTPEQEIRQLFRNHYRLAESRWVGGNNTIEIQFDNTPTAHSTTTKVWHKKHAWSGTDLDVWITVAPNWRRSIRDRGLAVLDGLLTTHVGRLRRDDRLEVYPASWIRQSKGLTIRQESGWIAYHRESGTAYHLSGGSATEAVAGLRRKLRNQAIPQEEKNARRQQRARERTERFERLLQRLARHDFQAVGDVIVTREDSLRAGNCVPGTDEFIDKFFPNRQSATIEEIVGVGGQTDVANLNESELTLARQIGAACLMAIRRSKRELRVVRLKME